MCHVASPGNSWAYICRRLCRRHSFFPCFLFSNSFDSISKQNNMKLCRNMTVHHLNILKFITSSKDHHRWKFMNIKVVQDMKHDKSRNMKGMARWPHARVSSSTSSKTAAAKTTAAKTTSAKTTTAKTSSAKTATATTITLPDRSDWGRRSRSRATGPLHV